MAGEAFTPKEGKEAEMEKLMRSLNVSSNESTTVWYSILLAVKVMYSLFQLHFPYHTLLVSIWQYIIFAGHARGTWNENVLKRRASKKS